MMVAKPKRICSCDICAADYTLAAQPCVRCGEPVGFDTHFVVVKESNEDFVHPTYLHAACVLNPNSQFA